MTTIAEIRARRAAITPGEWEAGVEVTTDRYIVTAKFQSDPQFGMAVCKCNVSHDARFIAAAPADIDHLLATIDKLAEALMEARLKQADNPYQAGTVEWLAHLSGTGHTISAQIEEEFGL